MLPIICIHSQSYKTKPRIRHFPKSRKLPKTIFFNFIKQKQFAFLFFFFILIAIVDCGASKPSFRDCSLDFNFSSPFFRSRCEGGDWGGFLHRNCCGEAFSEYLYELGKHANQTGDLYLNSTEQINCLAVISTFKEDVVGCGIEKLTRGDGGCSDFSLAEVKDKLGDKLRSLKENCEVLSSERIKEESCDSCVRSWQEIGPFQATSSNAESLKLKSDICRFAVLVSLISSQIEDTRKIISIFRCLRDQKFFSENEQTKQTGKTKMSKGTKIVIGALVGVTVMILISAFVLYIRRYKRSTPPRKTTEVFKVAISKDASCHKFSIREIYSATDNLSETNLIGEGNAGRVYKGILSNNQPVAIKHIIDEEDLETFVREVTSLSRVRHPNLVALLGCCVKEDECFLVYELCPNGNLSEWLFGKDKVLSWIQRLEVAIDSARGLWFLHTYPEGCIVHRDIKPTNILLGENFEAKLSDFGLSKVIEVGETFVSSEVRGTFGYVDPDYQDNRRVKSAGDVYSFGIVLLQIISGKKVFNMNLTKPMSLNKMAKALTRGGNVTEFADPKLEGEYSAEAFVLTLQLALSCTTLKRQRPSMEQIVEKLEEALDISTKAKASTPERSSISKHTTA
ncbi:hypothetical protein UlMin_014971 [Ulmus minor]